MDDCIKTAANIQDGGSMIMLAKEWTIASKQQQIYKSFPDELSAIHYNTSISSSEKSPERCT